MATAMASGALGNGGMGMFHLPTTNRPEFTQRATNCLLLTVSVVSICVLVVCGVMIVREYSLAKGYHASTCSVGDVDYAHQDIACMFCGPGPRAAAKEKGSGACKHSRFPCIRIKVTFTVDGLQREGLLHPDSLQAASPYAQCSYTICLKLPDDNTRAVEKYAQSWRDRKLAGESFPCFVDGSDRENVIVSKMHSMEEVVHSMVWPCLIVLICGCIFLRLEMKRRDIVPCRRGTTNCFSVTDPNHTEDDLCTNSVLLKCQTTLAAGDTSKVECKVLHCSRTYMSNSLTALDKLVNRDKGRAEETTTDNMGGSMSSDSYSLAHPQTASQIGASSSSSSHNKRPTIEPLAINSPSASPHGSRALGQETPV